VDLRQQRIAVVDQIGGRARWQLVRPRVTVMELITLVAAAWIVGGATPDLWLLLHACVGTACVIAGAISANQVLEFRSDRLMPRTKNRPIPTGRLSVAAAAALSACFTALGTVYLAVFTTNLITSLAAASFLIYAGIYTPLKQQTAWQMPIGAVAGAMPVFIGAGVAGDAFSPLALLLFAVVVLWQFPHTMAIAWLYREEYERARIKVASVVDRSGRLAGVITALGGSLLVGISAAALGAGLNTVAVLAAVALAAWYLTVGLRFARDLSVESARGLLRTSLIYLPVTFLLFYLGTS